MAKLAITTVHGLNPFDCVSALQKFIRRGMEREAGAIAFQLGMTNKQMFSWLCNRLRVISHEDIGLADMQAVMFTETAISQAEKVYPKPAWRLMIGNAIRALCRAPKSREGDHYQAVCWYSQEIEGNIPEIPEWTMDGHTAYGKKRNRGIEYFKQVSAVLKPEPAHDPYEADAYRLWELKEQRGENDDDDSEGGEGTTTQGRLL